MKLINFLHLNQQRRESAVLKYGVYVTTRNSGAFTIKLYAVEGYFAEIWYRKENQNVDLVRGFKSTGLLNPYLEKINLSGLVSACI